MGLKHLQIPETAFEGETKVGRGMIQIAVADSLRGRETGVLP